MVCCTGEGTKLSRETFAALPFRFWVGIKGTVALA